MGFYEIGLSGNCPLVKDRVCYKYLRMNSECMILLKMKIFLNNLVHLGFHIIRFTIVKEDMCA